jgi:hypothetical protein
MPNAQQPVFIPMEFWQDFLNCFGLLVLQIPPDAIRAEIGHLHSRIGFAVHKEGSLDNVINAAPETTARLKIMHHLSQTGRLIRMITNHQTPNAVLIRRVQQKILKAPYHLLEGVFSRIDSRSQ